MTYRRDNKKKHRFETALIVFVVLGALLLLFAPSRGFITGIVYRTAPGVWGFGERLSSMWQGISSNFYVKRSLLHENEMLQDEVHRMQALVLDRNLLEEKVSRLEESLGRTVGDDRVVADVLAVPGWSPYDTLVLDVGSNNGIAVGNLVVYAGSSVVGEIVEVYSDTAKAKLFSSPESERLVAVGPHAVPGKAHGKGLGNFEVILPQGSDIVEGDVVLNPGGHLVLGVVGTIQKDIAEGSVRVLFRSPWNVTEMRSVEVIKK